MASNLDLENQEQRRQEEHTLHPYSDRPNDHHGRYYSDRSGPAPGETAEQHAAHAYIPPSKHWGLERRAETIMFYCVAVPSWFFEIAAAVVARYYTTHSAQFAACATIWLVLWATAWLQTTTAMLQRASWVRDESNLKDRRQFLYLSVRLNRLMLPTALIAMIVFIIAYVLRDTYKDLAYWLLFLLFFIINTVACVMNAYNNIGWECERLQYEEGEPPMKYTRLAMFGIPS